MVLGKGWVLKFGSPDLNVIVPNKTENSMSRPLDVQLNNNYLISQPKHMLWVFKRNV